MGAPQRGEIILYQTADGRTKIDVKLENETVWLTQTQLCLLFDKSKSTISEHISNIFKEGELMEKSVVRNFRTTAADGKPYDIKFYNLDVIISVGYRVKSQRGTQFRIWANSVLKDYLIKGYAVRNNLAQQKYDDLKALVNVMGRTMGYLDSAVEEQTINASPPRYSYGLWRTIIFFTLGTGINVSLTMPWSH